MVSVSAVRRARGSQPQQGLDVARRKQLIEVAEDVFLEKGYHATTMDDIARRVGMSKKTIYVFFASKPELFDALLSEHLEPFSAPLPDDERPMAEVLGNFLTAVAQVALAPRKVEFTRLMIAEANRSPDVMQAVQRQPIARGEGTLLTWLQQQVRRGRLALHDSREACQMLLGMAVGELLLSQLLKAYPPPTAGRIGRRIRRSVDMFLKAHAVKSRRRAAPNLTT
jgi:AcrR family transcriptional regulator